MSVPQFDALKLILEPCIEKKTTNLRGLIDPEQLWILVFTCTVTLNCQNTSQNACYRFEECRKFQLIWIFLWRMKVSEAVCKHNWHDVRSYLFFTMQKFRTRISDSVCKDLYHKHGFLGTKLLMHALALICLWGWKPLALSHNWSISCAKGPNGITLTDLQSPNRAKF